MNLVIRHGPVRWLLRLGKLDEWLSAALVVLAAAAPASAQAVEPFELQWQAPEQCPSQRAVEARIRELLRGSPPSQGRLRATALIASQRADEYTLSLRIES